MSYYPGKSRFAKAVQDSPLRNPLDQSPTGDRRHRRKVQRKFSLEAT